MVLLEDPRNQRSAPSLSHSDFFFFPEPLPIACCTKPILLISAFSALNTMDSTLLSYLPSLPSPSLQNTHFCVAELHNL